MKPLSWIVAFLVLLAVPGGTAAAGQPLDSKITKVTVFANQAMVTRTASADAEAGTNRLVIFTDAFRLVSDSVTAAVFGEGEILGVQVVRVPVSEMPQETIREIESRIEDLEKEKKALLDAKKALQKQEAFLDGVVDFLKQPLADEIKTPLPPTGDLKAYLLFLDEAFTDVFDKAREIDGSISSLDREIERLRRELSMHRGARDQTLTGIEVLFSSDKTQTVGIEVRYMVERARWSPVYRASVGDDMKGVDLAMMAEIIQTTGEDWENAELTVSNAAPVRAGRLPELFPWRLDYTQPVPAREKAAVMRTMEMADTVGAAPQAEAVRRETALSFEYTLPVPVTVASREKETIVPILTRAIEGAFYHYTVPVLGADAYLVCEAKADRELLPGPVNVFFENRYTGRMILEEKGPGESFTLGLGVDRSVRVKREKIRDKATETAFFGRIERDSIIRELSYLIKAENLKDTPVLLKVTDHVPVSMTDRITVKDVGLSPAPDRRDVDGKEGVMQWDVELDPGAEVDIIIEFTVTYPKDMPRPLF